MFTEFETYIKERTKLSNEDISIIRSVAVEKSVRKNQFLLHKGEICRYKMFVSKGLLRTYRTTEDGSEHMMQFSPENSWTTDFESYHNAAPSLYNIDTLEYSEVVMWTKKNFDNLFILIPQLKVFSEELISRNLNFSRQRIFSAISSTVEEKYDDFIKSYPNVFARVPLHMVASYLGVSVKTLGRIRHAQLNR